MTIADLPTVIPRLATDFGSYLVSWEYWAIGALLMLAGVTVFSFIAWKVVGMVLDG